MCTEKGLPVESQGRKATGLRAHAYDSGAARYRLMQALSPEPFIALNQRSSFLQCQASCRAHKPIPARDRFRAKAGREDGWPGASHDMERDANATRLIVSTNRIGAWWMP
jgi:hypothetical protein